MTGPGALKAVTGSGICKEEKTMRNMKKLVAALLVLTMVLALAGSAMADCKFKFGQGVKFTKNAVAYRCKNGKATSTIVKKGSVSIVNRVSGNWVELLLDVSNLKLTRWFKTDALKAYSGKGHIVKFMDIEFPVPIFITYSKGGVGKSDKLVTFDDKDAEDEFDFDNARISPDCYKHVKAKASVWLHRENSLKKNYGRALRKGDKVTYNRRYGFDSRYVVFFSVKYKGKCLWVSSRYTELVK